MRTSTTAAICRSSSSTVSPARFTAAATRDLCAVLLPDSGRLQEEEAQYLNRHKLSKHVPAQPLYTEHDAECALTQFAPVEFGREIILSSEIAIKLRHAGHLLGASLVELRHRNIAVLFSGDLGRPNDSIMLAPAAVACADYLVVESTYGNRRHDPRDPKERLAEVINRTAARGGAVIVPAFAVGRAQLLLYLIYLLKAARAIADIPVFLNSPMAAEATRIFHKHPREHRLARRMPRHVRRRHGGEHG